MFKNAQSFFISNIDIDITGYLDSSIHIYMEKINNLQALRAFTALNVALFHTLVTSTAYGYELYLFSPLLGWGGNGADIFFVLSGFIMVYILNNKKVSPKDF